MMPERPLPMLQSRDGRKERAVDNWGDVECPFCDRVIVSVTEQNHEISGCPHCGAEKIEG